MDAGRPRSTFVTVVAWIFIALSGLGTAIAAPQNVMLFVMFRGALAAQAARPPPPGVPFFAAFLTAHVQFVFAGFLVLSVITLVSSIGLLKRRNWARMCFVGLMLFGVAWQLAGLGLQLVMMRSLQQGAIGPVADMQAMLYVMATMGALFAVGFGVLFGWIAKRLLAPAIAAEFVR